MPAETALMRSLFEPLMVPENSSFDLSDQELAQIRQILISHCGFNLDAYKDRCVRRRIAIRIRANHCESVRDYCNLLVDDKSEVSKLLKVLTIHVSQFFRNPSTFEKLRTEIIPRLFEVAREKGKKNLRFWSLGCASGEEPYSLALILAEHFHREILEIPVTIDATDVDAGTIETARKAIYNHERLTETPLNYISQYFREEGPQYKLAPSITAMVNFSTGEILNDLIYHHCDLLLCRNVLIYFAREQQEKVLENINRAIGADGFLVLGKTETILGRHKVNFQTVCPVERIYRSLDSFQAQP